MSIKFLHVRIEMIKIYTKCFSGSRFCGHPFGTYAKFWQFFHPLPISNVNLTSNVRTVSGSEAVPAHYFKIVNPGVSECTFNTTPWLALNRLMLRQTSAVVIFVQIKLFFSPNKDSFCVRTKEPVYPLPLCTLMYASIIPPLPCIRTKWIATFENRWSPRPYGFET